MKFTNLAKLPELCYATNPSLSGDGDAIVILKRGERGVHPYIAASAKADAHADLLNARMGVTPAERRAMEMGSMFGWDIPGADPDRHEAKVTRQDGESREDYLERCKADFANLIGA